MRNIWYVYILRCGDGTLYTGITDDVERRYRAHCAGKGAKYTRGRGPLEIVYREACGTRGDASRREYEVKKLPRREKMVLIERKNQMTYSEVRKNARGKMNPCLACPVCDGKACKNTIPGPGSKGSGTVFQRNYAAWQEILVNMDTIAENKPIDTSYDFFGQKMSLPIFAAPVGSVKNHYGDLLDEMTYDDALVGGCMDAGILAFTGDGQAPDCFGSAVSALEKYGYTVPTVKPWNRELVFERIDRAKKAGAKVIAMDVDGAGLPFLKNTVPPSGSKSVAELREIIEYAGVPFILKGIMTVRGAGKALEAGAAGIIVSNHGGRVLDQTPATAWVLSDIADAVGKDMKVMVDGGIRTGMDVFKALALGADSVLIGRPMVTCVYGAGREGIVAYCKQRRSELEDAMQMCGVHSLKEIGIDQSF